MGPDASMLQTGLVIVQTLTLFGGGVAAIIVMRNAVVTLKGDLKETKEDTKESFASVQIELKELVKVIAAMSVVNEQIRNLDLRVTRQADVIEDMRRGRGYVTGPPRDAVDGEYP